MKLLLEVFPDARFVHIHRNPYEVFRSSMHTAHKVMPWWTLQRPQHADVEERVCAQYAEVYEAYFAERKLDPPRPLHEWATSRWRPTPSANCGKCTRPSPAGLRHYDRAGVSRFDPRLREKPLRRGRGAVEERSRPPLAAVL